MAPLMEQHLLTLLRSQKKEGAQRPEVRVQLYTQDGREYDAEGKISFWDNRIDPDSGTLRLQAIFPNPDGMLLPGMFTRIKLSPPIFFQLFARKRFTLVFLPYI